MRTAAKILTLVASLLAFLVIVGVGTAAVGIPESGERGSGLVLTLAALLAFVAALVLVFSPSSAFASPGRRPLAAVATLAAIVPTGVLGWATLQFSGVPTGSPVPLLDWSAFALGAVFVAGTLSTFALGYWRLTGVQSSSDPREPPRQQDVRTAMSPPQSLGRDDDIRVTRI